MHLVPADAVDLDRHAVDENLVSANLDLPEAEGLRDGLLAPVRVLRLHDQACRDADVRYPISTDSAPQWHGLVPRLAGGEIVPSDGRRSGIHRQRNRQAAQSSASPNRKDARPDWLQIASRATTTALRKAWSNTVSILRSDRCTSGTRKSCTLRVMPPSGWRHIASRRKACPKAIPTARSRQACSTPGLNASVTSNSKGTKPPSCPPDFDAVQPHSAEAVHRRKPQFETLPGRLRGQRKSAKIGGRRLRFDVEALHDPFVRDGNFLPAIVRGGLLEAFGRGRREFPRSAQFQRRERRDAALAAARRVRARELPPRKWDRWKELQSPTPPH